MKPYKARIDERPDRGGSETHAKQVPTEPKAPANIMRRPLALPQMEPIKR